MKNGGVSSKSGSSVDEKERRGMAQECEGVSSPDHFGYEGA